MITLVHGYHDDTRVPTAAASNGLGQRLAIVLHPGCARSDDADFDMELVHAVLRASVDVLSPDALALDTIAGPRALPSGDFAEFLRTRVPSSDEIPNSIACCRHGALTGFIELEVWWAVGGDVPYSDSCTFVVYTADLSEQLEHACRAAAGSVGFTIQEVIRASPDLPRCSRLARLWRKWRAGLWRKWRAGLWRW
jgi:hypothetical protein